MEDKMNSLVFYLKHWNFSSSIEATGTSKKIDESARLRPSFVDRIIADGKTTNENIYHYDGEQNDELPPVNISYTHDAGRFLIASRDIAAGETIFWEKPLVVAPKAGVGPTCLNCFLTFSQENWPICSECNCPKCEHSCEGKEHTTLECKILRNVLKEENAKTLGTIKRLNIVLTPLRSYLASVNNPAVEPVLQALQSNISKRKKSAIGEFVDKFVVPFFQNDELKNVDTEFVHHACGIFDTNAFDMTVGESRQARALLPLASLMNHSCKPNTQHWFYEGRCVVKASVQIQKGEPITNTYTQTFLDTKARSSHLLLTKLFTCDCLRCQDPTEFGTNMGSILCQKCKTALCSPCEDKLGTWKCTKCNEEVSTKSILNLIHIASNIASRGETMEAKEIFMTLKKLRCMIGQQHYICIKLGFIFVKKTMEDIGSADDNTLLEVLSTIQFLLTNVEKVQPGLTKIRGILLLEKVKAVTELLSRGAKLPTINGSDEDENIKLENYFKELESDAEECVNILTWDSAADEARKARQRSKSQIGRLTKQKQVTKL